MKKATFIASLSNGQTIYEGKGDFAQKVGELSPWQRLLSYVAEESLTITSLSITTPDGRRYNLPSASNSPKFHAFQNAPKPHEIDFSRRMAGNVMDNGKIEDEEHYAVLEARYEDGKKVQLWVAEAEPHHCWTLIV